MLPWSVSAVTCLAACPDGSVFAAGYEDGKVEVFDAVVYNRLAVSPLKWPALHTATVHGSSHSRSDAYGTLGSSSTGSRSAHGTLHSI